jgi:hypothetical protein
VGARAPEARQDRLVHADCRQDDEGQVQAVQETPSQVAGRVRQIEDGGQKHEPRDQEHILTAAPSEDDRETGQGQQQLRGDREEQAEALGRERILGVERPALNLGVADEGEVAIEDVGRRDGEGNDGCKQAAPRGRPQYQRDRRRTAHQDRHLGVDRRLAQPGGARQYRQAEAPTLDSFQRQHDSEGCEHSRPREMGQCEHGVEGSELGHAPVERVRRVAEDHRVAESLDHVAHPEPDRAEEESEESRRAVLDEVGDEGPRRGHQRESGRHPGQVEDEDQGQVQQRCEVAEDEPEHEEVRGRALFGGVAVVPGPGTFPALAHLRQVSVRVVAQVEEAHEDLAVGLHGVRVQVGHRRDEG